MAGRKVDRRLGTKMRKKERTQKKSIQGRKERNDAAMIKKHYTRNKLLYYYTTDWHI